MKGRDLRCPHCGATALGSVASDFDLKNEEGSQHTFMFLRCDGPKRHDFTFSADAQVEMPTEMGARAQDNLARQRH